MRNRYPGICYRCHKHVAKGDGHFERYKYGWRVQHASCCIVYREIKQQEIEKLLEFKKKEARYETHD